jgi:hypothetical protein
MTNWNKTSCLWLMVHNHATYHPPRACCGDEPQIECCSEWWQTRETEITTVVRSTVLCNSCLNSIVFMSLLTNVPQPMAERQIEATGFKDRRSENFSSPPATPARIRFLFFMNCYILFIPSVDAVYLFCAKYFVQVGIQVNHDLLCFIWFCFVFFKEKKEK